MAKSKTTAAADLQEVTNKIVRDQIRKETTIPEEILEQTVTLKQVNPSCGLCAFYVHSHEVEKDTPAPHHGSKPRLGKHGHCHQKPPSIVHGVGPQVSFPMVHESDWCGEFKAKS